MMTTISIFLFTTFIVGLLLGWYVLSRPLINGPPRRKIKAGKYRNRDATKHITVRPDGGWSVDVNELLKSPRVQDDLRAMDRLYKKETIMALAQGKRPPNQVGGYGILTKKKLIIEWNDEWQKVMDSLSEYHAITYEILFGLPIKEFHPEAVEGKFTYYTDDAGTNHRLEIAGDDITHKDWIHVYGGEEENS